MTFPHAKDLAHRRQFRFGALLCLAFAGCASESPLSGPSVAEPAPPPDIELPGTVVVRSASALSQLVTSGDNRPIPLIREAIASDRRAGSPASTASATMTAEVKLSLDVEVRPPVVNGAQLQATHIAMNGEWAYVTYAQIGEGTIGAVDAFVVSGTSEVKLVARATFTNTEYYGVAFASNLLYLVGASSDPALKERAVLDVVALEGGAFSEKLVVKRVPLPSYAGTGVHVQGGNVWVTSGSGGPNTGGVTVFSERNLSELSHERFEDARAVHGAGRYVVVFSGRPGRARVYDAERRSVLGRPVDVGGASIPESKGTTWVEGDWAFLGAGDGGVKVISMTGDGAVVNGKGIPMPRVVNVAEALSTTNAVASDGSGFLYAASGETGVHVYSSNHRELKPGTSASEPTIEPLGRLDFGSKISANFVAANRERIIVASGLGGLKIVRIQ